MFPRPDAAGHPGGDLGTLSSVDSDVRAESPAPRRGEASCAWCGRPVDEGGTGRRRRYCRRSCRQRAYEQRRSLRMQDLPEGTVVLSEAESTDLMDRMFQLRCACEDLRTAIAEGEDPAELARMSEDLVAAARRAERLR
ncbi:hypothetical protein AB6N35_13910 [Dietzia cinnamea]|uniref:Uncharacterized protein n=1 Tax=Dietzia cinnamea TaxID=321318 RepID=A0ABV3YKT0_9ACTN|nr:hypothetical protein [Dietzia cinnamea]